MLSEGISPKASCPYAIDSKLAFLFLFIPSSNGGKNAAVFDILADAYPARRGEIFFLSGVVTFRFGRSLVVVFDNLPLSTFFFTCYDTPSPESSATLGGCLVGIWEN
jgi:hypothetical protein